MEPVTPLAARQEVRAQAACCDQRQGGGPVSVGRRCRRRQRARFRRLGAAAARRAGPAGLALARRAAGDARVGRAPRADRSPAPPSAWPRRPKPAPLAEPVKTSDLAAKARRRTGSARRLARLSRHRGWRAGEARHANHAKDRERGGLRLRQGLGRRDALSVVANSSDQHVRIPGNMKPHGVAVHPSPTLAVAVGWRSPAAATLKIEGAVQHAHPECGNGVAWSLELRRGNARQRLAAGISHGATGRADWPAGKGRRAGRRLCRPGDRPARRQSLVRSDGDRPDARATATRQWSLAGDVSPDILAGNPHADRTATRTSGTSTPSRPAARAGHVIPAGSLLAKWQAAGKRRRATEAGRRRAEAAGRRRGELPKDSPDAALVSAAHLARRAAARCRRCKPLPATPTKSRRESADSP